MILNLDEVLHDLAELASQVVPGNHGAGATLVQDGVNVYRSSNSFAQLVDRAQYHVGEGPCISAVQDATTVVSGTIKTGESRWPRFRASVSSLPVHSVLSLPLNAGGEIIGSVNVYSSTPDAFTDDAVAIGEELARPAAVTLSAAHLLVEAADSAGFAGYGLRNRSIVETAVGVLMTQQKLSAPAARRQLGREATATGASMVAAAMSVLDNSQQYQG